MSKKKGKSNKIKKNISSQQRPPVVTVLGHIDHGKTTLLDFIRKKNIAKSESGGITQHIGAYQARFKSGEEEKLITFIDTPGHEAFSKMRSRGAKVADVALLVISIKDQVMPQTKESITYIKKAKIPLLIAINKIDLFSKKERQIAVRKIEKQLEKLNILVEKQGGEVVCLPISALTGEGINELLEMIILLAEMEGLNFQKTPLKGVVIDSEIDSRKGVLATVLVREGFLEVRQLIKADGVGGKVKALFDEQGKHVSAAGPSKPVQVLGFEKTPPIGAIVKEKGGAKAKSAAKTDRVGPVEKKFLPFQEKEEKFKIILKTDTLGTKEAILAALGDDIEIVSSGVGQISESDVFLAKTANAIILGFKAGLSSKTKKLAQVEKVKIKIYQVIYRLLEEVEELVSFLQEKDKEKVLGRVKILAQFGEGKRKLAGGKVVEGRIARGDKIKIVRKEEEKGEGKIISLRHGKEDITKAEMGQECGMNFSKGLDFRVGDVVKSIG